MSYSLVIPMVEIIHIDGFRICGVSKQSSRTVSIHYDRNGKQIGRTVRNGFREPNHYGKRGEILGYSRNKTRSKIIHYDRKGKPIGYSRRVFWFLWIHCGLIGKVDVFYRLW